VDCSAVAGIRALGGGLDSRSQSFHAPQRGQELRALLPDGVRLVPQPGGDLGARLDRLLTDLVAEGAVGAVAVAADSPTLPTDFVRRARAHLPQRTADVVLGPCDDGGYYLIGLRQAAPELFTAMPWSTPAVLGETVARARRSVSASRSSRRGST